MLAYSIFSRMLAYSIFSRMLANKIFLFLTQAIAVIREITVTHNLKWNEHNRSITEQHMKQKRKYKSKTQQNTTNTWSGFQWTQNKSYKATQGNGKLIPTKVYCFMHCYVVEMLAYSIFFVPFVTNSCHPRNHSLPSLQMKWTKHKHANNNT